MSDTTPPPTAGPSPIADLSYRNYDGPLHSRVARWWPIALNGMRLAVKEKGFWFLIILCVMPYLIRGFTLYLSARAPQGLMSLFSKSEPGQKFAGQFYEAFTFQIFFLFAIAVTVGPKSISADNQANALLVYLSKPITKGDYLFGKWMSIFLLVSAVALLPALALYLFCLLSFTGDGFIREEPTLLFRLIATAFIPGALHASLLVGFSAWSKTPNIASSVYSGFYFISVIASGIVGGNQRNLTSGPSPLGQHLSIGGLTQGLAQDFYNVTLRPLNFGREMGFGQESLSITPPPLLPLLFIAACVCVLGVMAARARIRAVEVIKG